MEKQKQLNKKSKLQIDQYLFNPRFQQYNYQQSLQSLTHEDQQLLSYPIYRRLYNIVKQYKQSKEDMFRNNLIKELIFLLKIVPIMKVQLRQQFLAQVQLFYNDNDYKKINLASQKLMNLLNKFVKPVDRYDNKARPASGIPWKPRSINQFMRPNTAKLLLSSNKNKINNSNVTKTRPQSSKFGQLSTNLGSKFDSQDYCQNDDLMHFQLQNNGIDDLQRNQDYINCHRTFHPFQELPNKRLEQIIDKIEQQAQKLKLQEQQRIKQRQQYKSKLLQRSNNFMKKSFGQTLLNQSFYTDKQNTQKKQENHHHQHKLILYPDLHQQYGQLQQYQSQEEQDKISKKSIQYQQSENNKKQKKLFVQDFSEIRYEKLQNQDEINPFRRHFKLKNNNQKNNKKLNKKDKIFLKGQNIRLINNHQNALSSLNSYENLRIKIDYTKAKAHQRKEHVKKVQLMKLKTQQSLHKNIRKRNLVKTIQNENLYNDNIKKQNLISLPDNSLNQKNQFIKPKVIDLKTSISPKKTYLKRKSLPTYDKYEIFKKSDLKPISQFLKRNSVDRFPNPQNSKLSKHCKNYSLQSFDPISKYNIKSYNQQILQQIQKAKAKINQQKKIVSFNNLMRGLYINAYQDLQCDLQMKQLKVQNNKKSIWSDIDKGYMMFSKNQKKKTKKKKKRKNIILKKQK